MSRDGKETDISKPFTCKSYLVPGAPASIKLLGDKKQVVESAQHIIEFPGGAIELSRTDDGNYWAHIIVNRQYADTDMKGLHNAMGEIVGGRIDCDEGVMPLPNLQNITQIALLIKPTRP